MSHANFSPSAASRWLACPGSWGANANKHSESSDAAKEGTTAHEFAEWCLKEKQNPFDFIGKALQIKGWKETVAITKETAEAVNVYVQYIREKVCGADKTAAEIRLQMPGHPSFWGTADFVIAHDWGPWSVIDYKHGQGIDVQAPDNPQIAAYMLGALRYGRDKGLTPLSLNGVIIQPRVHTWEGPRIWQITDIDAFEAEWTEKFEQGIVACLGKDPERHPGDHCQFCLAKLECPELKDKLVLEAIAEFKDDEEITKKDVKNLVSEATLEDLLRIHKHASTIKNFIDETDKYLKSFAESGGSVPGYKLVQSVGNRKWTLDDEEMIKKFRNKKLKQDQFYVTKLKSPAQIEKVLTDPKFMEKFVTRPIKGVVLVADSDKRPAVQMIDAKEEFSE